MLRLLLTVGLLSASMAQADQSLYVVSNPLHHMTISTAPQAIQKRTQLFNAIWGGRTPAPLPITAFYPGNEYHGEMAPAYFGRTPATSQWFGFHMEHDIWARVHYSTFEGSRCLVVANGGHNEGFFKHADVPE